MKWQKVANNNLTDKELLKNKVRRAINNLTEHFTTSGLLPASLLSGGKDSSCTTSISLVAWRNAIKLNPDLRKIPFIIAYSDTRCENPIKASYLKDLIEEFKLYAKKHNFKLEVVIGKPTGASSWQTKIVGGYASQWDVRLPVGSGCAVDWKILALNNAVRPYEKFAKELGLTLTRLLGSRYTVTS